MGQKSNPVLHFAAPVVGAFMPEVEWKDTDDLVRCEECGTKL